jgi:hypothetical protein
MINAETVKDIKSDNLMEIKRVVDNELTNRGHLLYQSHAIRPKLRTFDMGVEQIMPRASAPVVSEIGLQGKLATIRELRTRDSLSPSLQEAMTRLVTEAPAPLDTFAELAALLPLPEKDISDLVEILQRHPQMDRPMTPREEDAVKRLGDYYRDHAPDVHKPTMAEFIEEGLELRRTAKDHMLAAEEERLTMEQRFIPWVGGVEVGTSMVLALKHATPARAAWILLLQNLRAGSMISIVHPHWGETQRPVPVESVNFYDKDKGWQNVVMLIAVKDPAKPDQPAVKFYTSLNEELLDEHMVPVVNHEWIKIQPVSE